MIKALAMRICKIAGCGRKHHALGYCGRCYARAPELIPIIRARARKYHRETNFIRFKIYEKTPPGFLMRMYRNMKSRVTGIQKQKHHLYAGLELWTKEEFYFWAKTHEKFYELYKIWKDAGYPRRLTPTVDRINSKKGYYIGNVEWVTHSENSRRGTISKHRQKKTSLLPFNTGS